MSKKNLFFHEAETAFVIEQRSVDAIAGQYGICEKTVRLWKEEGGWDEKRKAYLSSRQQFHEEMYEFCRALMKSVMEELKEGKIPDGKRLRTIAQIIPNIYKVKDYEDAMRKLSGTNSGGKNIIQDMARIIDAQLKGETLEEPIPAESPLPPPAGGNA